MLIDEKHVSVAWFNYCYIMYVTMSSNVSVPPARVCSSRPFSSVRVSKFVCSAFWRFHLLSVCLHSFHTLNQMWSRRHTRFIDSTRALPLLLVRDRPDRCGLPPAAMPPLLLLLLLLLLIARERFMIGLAASLPMPMPAPAPP